MNEKKGIVRSLSVKPVSDALALAQRALSDEGKGIQIRDKANELVTILSTVRVTDEQSHGKAGEVFVVAKTMLVHIHDYFEPAREASHTAYKLVLKLRDDQADPLEKAYKDALRRDGLWLLAEQTRREDEERARIEHQDAEAELQRMVEVEAARQSGDMEAAAELAAAPIVVPLESTPVAQPIQHHENVGIVKDFDFVIVAENEVPREFCSPDPRKIRAKVVAMRADTHIPGVRVFPRVTHRVSVA